MYSYTKLNRYNQNPARAFSWYEGGDKTAYDTKPSEALIFGKIVHAQIAGEMADLNLDEQKALYVRGNPHNGTKAAYKAIGSCVSLAKYILEQLHLNNVKFEQQADNGLLEGRYDVLADNVILDWKFVHVTDWDHTWSDRTKTYGDWIASTSYFMQAFVYMQILGRKPQHYYLVAIDKNKLDYRIYDLCEVADNYEMAENLEKLIADIQSYEKGECEPPFVDDRSDWAIRVKNSQPLQIIKPEITGEL
ncbi:PD-(D/E)XK nuclease-like domain-containing protein [Lactobacillus acetotolerans]|uniref:PD-(D/E)XK nuclease-like domain-containing protein n=1 Tax=Lactobacillus acetotolerans TaxID=1600 RepID=UPI002FDB0B5E